MESSLLDFVNWQDVAGSAAPRQLNNQNYNICFRTELVASQVFVTFTYFEIMCYEKGSSQNLVLFMF